MRFVTLVLKNVLRRRTRSALTVVGLSAAVGAVVSLVGIARGFERSFLDLYRRHGIDLVVSRSGQIERSTTTLDERLGEQIAKLDDVADVTPMLLDAVSFEGLDLFGVVVMGWRPAGFLFADLSIVEGRSLSQGDTREVLLGSQTAENLSKHVGESVEIYEGEPFTVVGVYESYNVWENGSMIVPLAELQHLTDRQGQVNSFCISVRNTATPRAIDMLRKRIAGLARGLTAMPTGDYVRSDTRIRAAQAMAWSTSLLALFVGAVGMLNTMAMSVFERLREIGILRAIGWRKSRVVQMILGESLVLSLAGAVVGSLGAVGTTRAISRLPTMNGLIDSDLGWFVVGQGFVIAFMVGLAGAAWPAYLGARLRPTDSIRNE
jgi:putative ABC transport system permease protein